MLIWTAKPASGFTLARDSRSVERTKKFPWKVCMDRPEEHNTHITPDFNIIRHFNTQGSNNSLKIYYYPSLSHFIACIFVQILILNNEPTVRACFYLLIKRTGGQGWALQLITID